MYLERPTFPNSKYNSRQYITSVQHWTSTLYTKKTQSRFCTNCTYISTRDCTPTLFSHIDKPQHTTSIFSDSVTNVENLECLSCYQKRNQNIITRFKSISKYCFVKLGRVMYRQDIKLKTIETLKIFDEITVPKKSYVGNKTLKPISWIEHLGSTAILGHYVCYRKIGNLTYKFNDSTVTKSYRAIIQNNSRICIILFRCF